MRGVFAVLALVLVAQVSAQKKYITPKVTGATHEEKNLAHYTKSPTIRGSKQDGGDFKPKIVDDGYFVSNMPPYPVYWGSFVPSHAKMVFKTVSNETISVASVNGLIWTDVTPEEMLLVIHVANDSHCIS